jgi:hypothetical protein
MKYMLIHAIDPAAAWLGKIEVRPILETRCGSPAEAS